MLKKQRVSRNASESREQRQDYTQIEVDQAGYVLLTFNMWDADKNRHVPTTLRLRPEEAQLMSDMLRRNADEAPSQRAGKKETGALGENTDDIDDAMFFAASV
jgi:hypothetical protein